MRDPVFGAREPVQRHDLAVDALRLLGGDLEGERRPVRLEPRRLERFTRLARDRKCELLSARADRVADRLEDCGALVRGESLRRLECRRRTGDRSLDRRRARSLDIGDRRPVVGTFHGICFAALGLFARDEREEIAELWLLLGAAEDRGSAQTLVRRRHQGTSPAGSSTRSASVPRKRAPRAPSTTRWSKDTVKMDMERTSG